MLCYLKLADAAAWATARALLPATAQIDEIGVIYWVTGTTVVDGVTVPTMAARPGWHVNVVCDDLPAALYPALVNPAQPKRVMFGAQVLSMPEPMPEAGGTAMIERGVGSTVPDGRVAAVESDRLRARLASVSDANRPLLLAQIAVVDARTARQARADARDGAVAALQAADAARTALLDQRAAQQAIRDDAVAKLLTLTGAARIPEVARRDAARDEIDRLTVLIQTAADARPGLVAARDAAVAALQAAVGALAAARVARDALVAQQGG